MQMTMREAFDAGTIAFNNHDIDAFAAVLADDVVFAAPGGLQGTGKGACADFYRGWFETFPDAHVAVDAVHLSGDVIVEEGTFTGTHDGILRTPGGEIAPTGRRVSVPYIHVLRFRDAKPPPSI
jgi:ketosteroid isomerase-like protein